jgi:hypothetical protein
MSKFCVEAIGGSSIPLGRDIKAGATRCVVGIPVL